MNSTLVERDTQTFDKTMLQEKYYPICLFKFKKKALKALQPILSVAHTLHWHFENSTVKILKHSFIKRQRGFLQAHARSFNTFFDLISWTKKSQNWRIPMFKTMNGWRQSSSLKTEQVISFWHGALIESVKLSNELAFQMMQDFLRNQWSIKSSR